ncbi:cell division protein FtsQ/DivIB [Patescibacteria group bacterium]
MRPKELSGKLKTLSSFSLGLFLLGLGIFVLKDDLWQVKKIECSFNEAPCSMSLWAELMNLAGQKNILLLRSAKFSSSFRQKHPNLSQVVISKKFPSTLVITLQEKKPVVAIKQGDQYLLVDQSGLVLKVSQDTTGLPVYLIESENQFSLGERVLDEVDLKVIEVLSGSLWRLLEPETARINLSVVEVTYKGGLIVLFSVDKEATLQLDSLQFILSRLKIEGRQPRNIDLRFDKPVLVE